MISNFNIENKLTGKKITFGQEPNFDYLYKDDGLDWGSVPVTHNTYNYLNQVGVSISSTKINTRDISIVGYVFYMLSRDEMLVLQKSEWEEYCYSKIKEKKKILDEVINPTNYIRINIGNYYIDGKPNSSVQFGKNSEDNNIYFCKFIISVFCNNPMFKKNTITKSALSGSSPAFHFPLVLKPQGIIMSTRIDYLLLNVENEGSSAVGGRIIIQALGDVLNPTIENLTTGGIIKVNKMLTKGETVIINTRDGDERGITGIIDGEETNYIRYWSFKNEWFKFIQGTTLIGYSTENGSEDSMKIYVEINPEKFSLEEM